MRVQKSFYADRKHKLNTSDQCDRMTCKRMYPCPYNGIVGTLTVLPCVGGVVPKPLI